MQYRQFTGQRDELKRRIRDAEKEHFQVSMDLKVLESLHRDERILEAATRLKTIEQALAVLYEQLPPETDGQ